ncbi:MAG: ABC transporter substrate-binding protein [Planctomycetota bacterium]
MPRALLIAVAAVCFLACGGSDAPLTEASAERSSGRPVRIVPANTAAAEFLATILGDEEAARIAAIPEQVDAYSNLDFKRPPWSSISRFSRYEPEPLITLRPDLVVTHAWQSADTTHILRAQNISVVVLASARGYEEIRDQIASLGKTLAAEERAARVLSALDERVAALRASAARREGLRVLEYANDGTGGWTAGLDTTADAMIRLAGMRNAAGEESIHGHVRLDSERLLTLDPDILLVGAPARDDTGSPTKGVLEGVPEYASLSAVKKGRIVVLPASLLSSDSPCLVDAAERLAAEVDLVLSR